MKWSSIVVVTGLPTSGKTIVALNGVIFGCVLLYTDEFLEDLYHKRDAKELARHQIWRGD